jgi:predicted transcriptional regulator
LADIEAGLAEAKAGDFASPAEVSEVLARYTVDSAQK